MLSDPTKYYPSAVSADMDFGFPGKALIASAHRHVLPPLNYLKNSLKASIYAHSS